MPPHIDTIGVAVSQIPFFSNSRSPTSARWGNFFSTRPITTSWPTSTHISIPTQAQLFAGCSVFWRPSASSSAPCTSTSALLRTGWTVIAGGVGAGGSAVGVGVGLGSGVGCVGGFGAGPGQAVASGCSWANSEQRPPLAAYPPKPGAATSNIRSGLTISSEAAHSLDSAIRDAPSLPPRSLPRR